jgi:hypothetical protein
VLHSPAPSLQTLIDPLRASAITGRAVPADVPDARSGVRLMCVQHELLRNITDVEQSTMASFATIARIKPRSLLCKEHTDSWDLLVPLSGSMQELDPVTNQWHAMAECVLGMHNLSLGCSRGTLTCRTSPRGWFTALRIPLAAVAKALGCAGIAELRRELHRRHMVRHADHVRLAWQLPSHVVQSAGVPKPPTPLPADEVCTPGVRSSPGVRLGPCCLKHCMQRTCSHEGMHICSTTISARKAPKAHPSTRRNQAHATPRRW